MDFSILSKMDANEMLAELFNTAVYKGFLQVMSRFSSYSWRNIFLIYKQLPHASKLVDFDTWKEQYGRTVIRGSTSIKIFSSSLKCVMLQEFPHQKRRNPAIYL